MSNDSLQQLVPGLDAKINGRKLPDSAMSDLTAVTVTEDVSVPSMFTLKFMNGGLVGDTAIWSDDDLLQPGNEVEIQMGYQDNLSTLIKGDITGLEPEYSSAEAPLLTVRGYDRRHLLMRGRHTRTFVEMKDSEIAKKIASDRGLSAEAQDTGVTLDYVLQHNQTDMDFLNDRARRIGFEVTVEDKKMYFRPRQTDGKEVLTLEPGSDLMDFYPRLTVMSQVGRTEVQGWDPAAKDTIAAQATAKDVNTKMGGSVSGPEAADKEFKSASLPRVDWPVFSKAEADQIAKGQLDTMALAYIEGEGVCIGCPELKAGKVIKIEGLGKRFSGLYYVTATRHAYTAAQGYSTAFNVKRNAT